MAAGIPLHRSFFPALPFSEALSIAYVEMAGFSDRAFNDASDSAAHEGRQALLVAKKLLNAFGALQISSAERA